MLGPMSNCNIVYYNDFFGERIQMKLQNIIWPKQGVCTEEKLYFHSNMIDEDFNIDRDENHRKANLNYVNYDKLH